MLYHTVQHLRGCDDGLSGVITAPDDVLLDDGDLGKVDLHAHIAARHHNAVGHVEDLVDVFHAFVVFDLGHDFDEITFSAVQQAANLQYIGGAAYKGGCDEVKALLNTKQDVIAVLRAHIRHRELGAGHIHALMVGDRAAVLHGADNVVALNDVHLHADKAVVQQHTRAGREVLRQFFVSDGTDVFVAFNIARGERKCLPGFQRDLAVFKILQADLRAFGIQQGGHRHTQLVAQCAQLGQPGGVFLVGAMGKVETGYIHPAHDHIAHHAFLICGRSQRADDFCFTQHSQILQSAFCEKQQIYLVYIIHKFHPHAMAAGLTFRKDSGILWVRRRIL